MEEKDLMGEMEKILKELSPEQQKYLLEQAHGFLQTEGRVEKAQTPPEAVC